MSSSLFLLLPSSYHLEQLFSVLRSFQPSILAHAGSLHPDTFYQTLRRSQTISGNSRRLPAQITILYSSLCNQDAFMSVHLTHIYSICAVMALSTGYFDPCPGRSICDAVSISAESNLHPPHLVTTDIISTASL